MCHPPPIFTGKTPALPATAQDRRRAACQQKGGEEGQGRAVPGIGAPAAGRGGGRSGGRRRLLFARLKGHRHPGPFLSHRHPQLQTVFPRQGLSVKLPALQLVAGGGQSGEKHHRPLGEGDTALHRLAVSGGGEPPVGGLFKEEGALGGRGLLRLLGQHVVAEVVGLKTGKPVFDLNGVGDPRAGGFDPVDRQAVGVVPVGDGDAHRHLARRLDLAAVAEEGDVKGGVSVGHLVEGALHQRPVLRLFLQPFGLQGHRRGGDPFGDGRGRAVKLHFGAGVL